MQHQPVHESIQKKKKTLLKLTKDLCAFQTVNPPGHAYEACVDFLVQYAKVAGFKTQKIRVPLAFQKAHTPEATWKHPRFNVVCRWNTGSNRTLHLNSHYDVVPVSPDWKTHPFKPVERNGKLYGRGTTDMKGCLAASLTAMIALKESGAKPAWNIELSFTADEETGGECGAGYLVKQGIVQPDAAIVCEGGMGDCITYGHRGILWIDISIQGKAGHGSTPSSGVNAFEHGIQLAQQLMQHKQTFSRLTTRHLVSSNEYLHPTLTLGGVCGGGSKVNTIPDTFHFTLDRRLLPEEKANEVIQEYQTLVQQFSKENQGITASLEVFNAYNAAVTDPEEPICKTIGQAVHRVYQKKPRFELFGAFTDLHFFANYGNCPTVGYGVEGAGIHSSGEYCFTDSLVKTAQVYAETALTLP